jgi:acetyl-CoA synthetase
MLNSQELNTESAPLSWLQSNNGEWQYFADESLVKTSSASDSAQDYIWLVSQATASHKVCGYRIANQTMENFIEQLAGVEQAIVIGIPHENKGNALHVFIELSHLNIEKNTLLNAINAKLAGGIGEFARADVIKFVENFPIEKNKQKIRKNLKFQAINLKCAA